MSTTLLFTDVEGSTRLLHELGDGYAAMLAEHLDLPAKLSPDEAVEYALAGRNEPSSLSGEVTP